MQTEKRRSPRVSVDLPLDYELGTERRAARALDLSLAGVSLELDEALPVGSWLHLGFELPGGRPRVEATGEVVWAVPGEVRQRAGIRFDRFLSGYVELSDYVVQLLGGA